MHLVVITSASLNPDPCWTCFIRVARIECKAVRSLPLVLFPCFTCLGFSSIVVNQISRNFNRTLPLINVPLLGIHLVENNVFYRAIELEKIFHVSVSWLFSHIEIYYYNESDNALQMYLYE